MTLSSGSRLGHYEVVEAIGKGGMGEVYRARDTRLPRDAAIKISGERFSERFTREAHVIASLNHPNISTLFDVGDNYLVMELVEGPTLADRIRQRPLTLDEASSIARQIADALDYAHERGVVHRDLKPGNVKIRPDGVVKVLDFGLAKMGVSGVPLSGEAPTITMPQTDVGVVLGTAAYMAPEQARGREVDRRADIWAFGCMFYEMLTGAPPHQRDSSQETMASILRDEPDLSRVPAQAHRLLKRCLEKDPQKRLRHIGDVMSLLDDPPSGQYSSSVSTSAVHEVGGATAAQTKWLWPAVAGAAVIAAGVVLTLWAPWRGGTAPAQSVRFEVGESEGMRFFYGGAMAVSPDGRWLVFPATSDDGVNRYWIRSLDTVEARALPGTEGAYVPAAWTADSRHVIFTVLGSNQIRKVDIQGGPPQVLGEMPGLLNGATGNQDAIVFASSFPGQPLSRIPVAGGATVPLTVVREGENGHKFPQLLPDGRRFIYFRVSNDPNIAGIYAGSLDVEPAAQSLERVLATDRQAYYAVPAGRGPGHMVFMRGTTLMAQPFDPERLQLSGEAVPVAENVDSFPPVSYALFGVSDSGTLVYRAGAESGFALTSFDGTGRLQSAFGEPGFYSNPAVSPDGTRIAVARRNQGEADIWIIDLARNTTQRFTFDPGNDDNPVWSPDGRNIAFSSTRSGQPRLYLKPADGLGEERLLTDQLGVPTHWSKDGRYLLFTSGSGKTGSDIWVLPEPGRGEARPVPVLVTEFAEAQAQLSPDGRWIAYQSNESSMNEIYVRPFTPDRSTGASGAKYLVSRGFSLHPRWRADGARLLYAAAATLDLMAVDIDTSNGFQAGTPRRLFAAPPPLLPTGWDLAPSGNRFFFVATPDGGRPARFTVVLNWAASLAR